MKKTIFYPIALFAIVTLWGCAGGQKEDSDSQEPKQLNVTVLLDLSDRISSMLHPATPSHMERDIAIVGNVATLFTKDMEQRGTFNANGRIQVMMEPLPAMQGIDDILRRLMVDCSALDVKQKKTVHDSLTLWFSDALHVVYGTECAKPVKEFLGSDIWRFFQNKAHNLCVSPDTNYRNILIVLTDGYIYDPTTTLKVGNKVQNLTVSTIGKYRQYADPVAKIKQDGFGLIEPQDVDLGGLEVLVLEIDPEKNHSQADEAILKHCIRQWLTDMGVARCEVYPTDALAHVAPLVKAFFEQ